MKVRLTIMAGIFLSGCTVERIGPPGVTLTRPIRVKSEEVKVFQSAADVKDHFSVVDTVFVKDDGQTLPRVLERQLRVMAGARGANAIITDPLNRRLNGTRVDLRPTLDNSFEYFSATAIWIGDGEPPRKYLGTLGEHR
ncbi:hypothetical protein U1708_00080 [Sphingomonas sp. ZB1N12]|uniref:hypothetical protein n=1 Tax=Sphingomonas arabinosi TaxID=3096160 RepID=UPI002FCB245C